MGDGLTVMDSFLALLIPGSFLFFLAVIVGLLIYGADKLFRLLNEHLERLHDEFDAMHEQQAKNHELLIGILRKLIQLQADNK